jgi:hypothetical protein
MKPMPRLDAGSADIVRALAVLFGAGLAFASGAQAKEFASLVVVGADGSSVELHSSPRVVDQLFSASDRVAIEGGYVRLYPLGPTGHVGVPGRFYPAARAVCLAWDQSLPPRDCRLATGELLALLGRARTLAPFRGAPSTVALAESQSVPRVVANQLRVAFELAFDRSRLARRAGPTTTCRRFAVRWRGPQASLRPRSFCLSPEGVRAGRLLYPLGPEPWRLASANACSRCGSLRTITRAGVSVLYPASWYALTIDRHVTNPVLRFQLSTVPGASGASVPRGGVVIRVEELMPPLLGPRGVNGFPPRPARFALATFRRMDGWPRGLGTAFREAGRAFYVWVGFGPGRSAALDGRVEALLDTLAVRPRRA